jgi:hypothetical protein
MTLIYTNIDTTTDNTAIKHLLETTKKRFQTNLPYSCSYMSSSILVAFPGSNYTAAMGTPTACAFATLTYKDHKNSEILTKFSTNLKESFNIWGTLKWVIETYSTQTIF